MRPKIKEVAAELRFINKQTFYDNGADDPRVDIRLQVYAAGEWYIHVGDPRGEDAYQGFWGATTIPGNRKRFSSIKVARDLIDQADGHWYQETQ